jgi:hypothetical protein
VFTIELDDRTGPELRHCPQCPNHEGRDTHQRLAEVMPGFRQCPRCHRVYCVFTAVSEGARTSAS